MAFMHKVAAVHWEHTHTHTHTHTPIEEPAEALQGSVSCQRTLWHPHWRSWASDQWTNCVNSWATAAPPKHLPVFTRYMTRHVDQINKPKRVFFVSSYIRDVFHSSTCPNVEIPRVYPEESCLCSLYNLTFALWCVGDRFRQCGRWVQAQRSHVLH